MVIHDMRSPTTSIKMGLFYTCQLLETIPSQRDMFDKSYIDISQEIQSIRAKLNGSKKNSSKVNSSKKSSSESLVSHSGVIPDIQEVALEVKELEMDANQIQNEISIVLNKLRPHQTDVEDEDIGLDVEEGCATQPRSCYTQSSKMILDKTDAAMEVLLSFLGSQGVDVENQKSNLSKAK